jgi:L-lactate dehydrogenase complex protein LldG
MSERENILARIREALVVPAPMPGHAHDGVTHPTAGSGGGSSGVRQWLPLVGDTFKERLELFRTNAAALKADFHLLTSRDELSQKLLELREAEGWKKVGTHAGELTDFACGQLALPTCRTVGGYDVAELESCSVAITECDALVAQTGSVLVTSRSAGGRALSVLPPHHVVLAQSRQLLGDLPEAFAFLKKIYAPGYPSFISFITGPSRTGDIERILVLGAHGPRKLTILCL